MSKDGRTERYEDLWLAPVDDASELPAEADDGQMCFVQREGMVYAWQDGRWIGVAARPKPSVPPAPPRTGAKK